MTNLKAPSPSQATPFQGGEFYIIVTLRSVLYDVRISQNQSLSFSFKNIFLNEIATSSNQKTIRLLAMTDLEWAR
jgi:hypothetical protein